MTDEGRIRSIAIVGGGTAGWLAASMLARALPAGTSITVIESAQIGTIGVGEATIPPFVDVLRFLGIDELQFVRATGATYKLAIRYRDWSLPGESYWHPFGTFGAALGRRPFHHYWHHAVATGESPRITEYSLCAALGEAGKFCLPQPRAVGAAAGLRHALHFDAAAVSGFLRSYAHTLGVQRLERTVATATRRADGAIGELVFQDGSRFGADLYIDCSGFHGVLIEQVLHCGYVSWGDLLPCDRAVAAPTAIDTHRPPYTLSSARSAGWHWRIPLQERFGNGYVYSSAHLSDTAAIDDLVGSIGTPLSAPRLLRFTAGHRRALWRHNCVALGLASGFLEPLESTSIQLVINGVFNLLDHFPDRRFDAANIAAYNRELIEELEHIRDFLILHYWASRRVDGPFWPEVRAIRLPDSLQERIALYQGTGRIRTRPNELFTDLSWFYIFVGLGLRPQSGDPLIDAAAFAQARTVMRSVRQNIEREVQAARSHDSYFAAGQPAAVQSAPAHERAGASGGAPQG
ncbi:MAG: tryptophan halogenase family protein [Steroidobacteraceae bacterium]